MVGASVTARVLVFRKWSARMSCKKFFSLDSHQIHGLGYLLVFRENNGKSMSTKEKEVEVRCKNFTTFLFG